MIAGREKPIDFKKGREAVKEDVAKRLPQEVDLMENQFIDTHVVLRYLSRYDPSKYERGEGMFKRAREGEIAFQLRGWSLRNGYGCSCHPTEFQMLRSLNRYL